MVVYVKTHLNQVQIIVMMMVMDSRKLKVTVMIPIQIFIQMLMKFVTELIIIVMGKKMKVVLHNI